MMQHQKSITKATSLLSVSARVLLFYDPKTNEGAKSKERFGGVKVSKPAVCVFIYGSCIPNWALGP
jgi:hypothetical protein